MLINSVLYFLNLCLFNSNSPKIVSTCCLEIHWNLQKHAVVGTLLDDTYGTSGIKVVSKVQFYRIHLEVHSVQL